MLYIRFGEPEDDPMFISNIDGFFDFNYDPEWITQYPAIEIIRDIDKSEVVNQGVIDSPFLGPISPRDLSSGVKVLLSLFFMPEYEYGAHYCGDNCATWIQRIAEHHDIKLSFVEVMRFQEPFTFAITNDNSTVNNMYDFILKLDSFDREASP